MIDREYEKCKKDCIVCKRTDSFNEMFDYFLQFKGEAKKVIIKLLNITYTYELKMVLVLIHMLFLIFSLNEEQLLV